MVVALFKLLLFFFTRPLALYKIYPGALALIMAGSMQTAQIQQEELSTLGGENLILLTEDNRQLEAMYFSVNKIFPEASKKFSHEKRPTVLFCLGNDMLFQLAWPKIQFYLSHGLNVIAFNYGGYGKSEGSPSAERTFLDAEAAYQYISTTKKVPDHHILVHGFSLGGGPATHLASKYPIHLVLDRTYATLGQAANNFFLGILADYLYPYNNLEKIHKVKGRIHIVEADRDERMNPEQATQLLHEIARSRHPEALKDPNMEKVLRSVYVTTIPGKHNACVLHTPPLQEEAQNHFIECVLSPMVEDSTNI